MNNLENLKLQVTCKFPDLRKNPDFKIYRDSDTYRDLVLIRFTSKEKSMLEKESFLGKLLISLKVTNKNNSSSILIEEHSRGFDEFLKGIENNDNENSYYLVFLSGKLELRADFFVRSFYWILEDLNLSKDYELENPLEEYENKLIKEYTKKRNHNKKDDELYFKIKVLLEREGVTLFNLPTESNINQNTPLKNDEDYNIEEELDFEVEYVIETSKGNSAYLKINEDMTFSILKHSIISKPKKSQELKDTIEALLNGKFLEEKPRNDLLINVKNLPQIPIEDLIVLKEIQVNSIEDAIKLIKGKEQITKAWNYLEDGQEIKEQYERIKN